MKEKIEVIEIFNPETNEIIIGQGNFTVKTIEDFEEVLLKTVPAIEFGAAMNEAKPQLVRVKGNNEKLKKLAGETALKIGAGHVFVLFFKNAYPIQILNAIKAMPTVASIFIASSNPTQVVTIKTSLGKAVIGAVDGSEMKSIESEKERKERLELLKKLGF